MAGEAVAAAAEVFVDFLQGFAYAAYVRGDYDRARELSFTTLPMGAGWIQTWLISRLYGDTTDPEQTRRDFDAEHPWDALHAFTAAHGRRLFEDELARWSEQHP